jgi:hypothetical protein
MRRRAESEPRDQLHGWVAPGFEPVQQAFADNFAQRGELGAACAVYRHGEPVVDLWGGLRDRGLPWRQDTLVDIAKLSVGREEYYTRELATDHEQYLSGHGESRPGGCPTCYRRCRRSSGRRGWPGWPTGPGCGFAPASDRLPR